MFVMGDLLTKYVVVVRLPTKDTSVVAQDFWI